MNSQHTNSAWLNHALKYMSDPDLVFYCLEEIKLESISKNHLHNLAVSVGNRLYTEMYGLPPFACAYLNSYSFTIHFVY